ncbi:MAG: sensor histidine kinase [Rhizomicrobium sp.]
MTRWVSWLLPRTLAAQLIVTTVIAVIVSNFAVAAWFTATHNRLIRAQLMDRVVDRAASAAGLLDSIPASERRRVSNTMSSGPWRFELTAQRPRPSVMTSVESSLAARVQTELPAASRTGPVSVQILRGSELRAHPARLGSIRHARRLPARMMRITIPLDGGSQLVTTFLLHAGPPWPIAFIYGVLVAVLTAAVVAAFAVRRVTRPLSQLTSAASMVAHGGEAPRLDEAGPQDMRRAAQAFNAMTDQVRRMLESQRQLLSAVGHDLRTPLTAMRISTEFIDDDEVRERIEKNLDELRALTDAVLSAARGAGWEKRRRIDLAALVESVCADLEDMGQAVSFHPHPAMTVLCRRDEIRRAVRNLLENAVTYGGSAELSLSEESGMAVVRIDDHGPGIAPQELDRVFEPFVRLEGSRNQETGGAGLGLTLVKTIAEGHGGSITLQNRPQGGLSAILRLPREAEAA